MKIQPVALARNGIGTAQIASLPNQPAVGDLRLRVYQRPARASSALNTPNPIISRKVQ